MQTLPFIPVETLAPVRTGNPGIVPPWLQQTRPVGPDHPVGDDVPRILGGANPTVFDRTPVLV